MPLLDLETAQKEPASQKHCFARLVMTSMSRHLPRGP
jgi:hypothetical protein